MFCSKCGNQLPENVKFCVVCGAPVSRPENTEARERPYTPSSADIAKYTSAAKTEVTELAQKLSLSMIGLGACAGMAFIFVYNLFNYLGPWNLTIFGFLSSLLAPALFAWLIATQAQKNGKQLFFAAPFALKAFVSLINLFRGISYLSLQGWLTNLSHIALAALFILTVFGMFSGKKAILALSGTSAAVLGILAFRSGFMSGIMQILYFASIIALIYEMDIDPLSADQAHKRLHS